MKRGLIKMTDELQIKICEPQIKISEMQITTYERCICQIVSRDPGRALEDMIAKDFLMNDDFDEKTKIILAAVNLINKDIVYEINDRETLSHRIFLYTLEDRINNINKNKP